MDLAQGSVVDGRYRAQFRVGIGGMGEVWAAEHLSIGVKVAMKRLLNAAAVNHEVVARFKREAYLLGRIRSDHVARVLDFVNDPDFGLVLVMEFIEGEVLARILQLRPLNVEETIDLGYDIVSALVDLHAAHVVHRDLKPGNIMLQPGEMRRRRAIIVDLGISRLLSTGDEETITGITKLNMALGTVEYMAPEQVLNSRDVTASSDLYAVGAMLFRAVAGEHVFGAAVADELAHKKLVEDAPPLRTGRSDRVAAGLEAVVARALRRRPGDRYERAQQMLDELTVLRDLAHFALLDLDSTTVTHDPPPVSGPTSGPTSGSASGPISGPTSGPISGPFSGAGPESAPRSAVPIVAPAMPVTRTELIEPSRAVARLAMPAPVRERGGLSVGVASLAVLVALSGGAALGAAGMRHRLAGVRPSDATDAASPSCTSVAERAGDPPADLPRAAASGAPAAIDLGEIDEVGSPRRQVPSAAPMAAPRSSSEPPRPARVAPSDSGRASAPTVDQIRF